MKHHLRTIAIGAALVAFGLMAVGVLSLTGVVNYDVWTREQPLLAPIGATSVRDGAVVLADGRVLCPAGVRRVDGVSVEDYDLALRVIVAQGVVVVRDLGDGTAILRAEPRFYNPCGTRRMDGNPLKRWGGSYIQCPESELLLQTGYATPALDHAGLSAKERWRLEGATQLSGVPETPIADRLMAFRSGGESNWFGDYDGILETVWKPPPSP